MGVCVCGMECGLWVYVVWSVGCTHWIPGEAAGQVKVVGLMNIHHISLLLNLYPATSRPPPHTSCPVCSPRVLQARHHLCRNTRLLDVPQQAPTPRLHRGDFNIGLHSTQWMRKLPLHRFHKFYCLPVNSRLLYYQPQTTMFILQQHQERRTDDSCYTEPWMQITPG